MKTKISIFFLLFICNFLYSQVDDFFYSDTSIVTLPNGRVVKNGYSTNMKLARNDNGVDSLITTRYSEIVNLSTFNTTLQKNLIIYYHNDDLLVIESLETLEKRFLFLKLEGDGGYDEFSSKTFYTSDGLYLTLYYDGYENGKKKLTEIDYRSMEFGNPEDILYHYFNEK